MFIFLQLTVTSLLTTCATAHGGIWNYSVAGVWRPGFFPYYPAEGQSSIQRHWIDFAPVINVSAPWIVCNNPGSYAEEVAVIEAGSKISAYYRGWPHDIGPILTWMAYCGPELTSCASFNGTGKHWFKIAQQGLMSGTIGSGLWAQKDMVNKNFTWTVTIPETLRGGAYLVRHELIALHVPLTPEFYPECAHFFVESKENGEPSQEYLASIPGVWAEEDPELHLDIYGEPTLSRESWTIPGPDVWTGFV